MRAIVAVDNRWGIGKDGELLVHLSEDLKFFKRNTIGKAVIMGRKTLESFPGGRPLPDRENIVLTRQESLDADVTLVHTVEEAVNYAEDKYNEDVFVIGGGEVYMQLLPFCDDVLVTKIRKRFDADTFFPNLDELPGWQLADESDVQEENGVEYTWCRYFCTTCE